MDKDTLKFTKSYYKSRVWGDTFWMGATVKKCPLDLWIYQEIIYETKPDIIIEGGTLHGGSALYLANVCDLIGNGQVLTIDIVASKHCRTHPRIEYIIGSTLDQSVVDIIKSRIVDKRVMVILDDDHSRNHVFNEMELYGNFVSPGCYMIVEDGFIDNYRENIKGPSMAIKDYLTQNSKFVTDETREKFGVTFNPGGYLKKRK